MKYCSHCGKQVEDDVVYCPYCGFETEAATIEKAQENYYDGTTNEQTTHPVEIGTSQTKIMLWGFISCLFPLLGFIMGFVWRSSKPELSNSCFRGATIGVCFDLIYALIEALGGR